MIPNTLEEAVQDNYCKELKEAKKKGLEIKILLEQLATDICDNYCKWQDKYGSEDDDQDRLYDDHCSKCPLNIL